MGTRLRIGAVSYLNARPLVHGLEDGTGAGRIRLSCATPAVLADQLAAGELDVALLPVVELARIPNLELVPGLAIATFGPSRSVLLVSRRPAAEIESIALDPDSRSSNALARLLLAEVWRCRPEVRWGHAGLERSLDEADATVRIGDKALFEPPPKGAQVYDLGTAWTEATGLPFVFAAWAARAGVVDSEVCDALHGARRAGIAAIDRIAAEFTWKGKRYPRIAREYLTEHIRFHLGPTEVGAMERFFDTAQRLDLIDVAPPIRLAALPVAADQDVASGIESVTRPVG